MTGTSNGGTSALSLQSPVLSFWMVPALHPHRVILLVKALSPPCLHSRHLPLHKLPPEGSICNILESRSRDASAGL